METYFICMDNHWIALYLSGQYPWKYIIPNKLDIIFKIRQIDPSNFGDPIVSLLQWKTDVEYFKTLLDTFGSIHDIDSVQLLLSRINVPEDVRTNPYEITSQIEPCSIQELSTYLDSVNETDFSRFVIMPILIAMGYENVEYKWKVNETDFGNDFYAMKYISPSWLAYYTGVQTKACRMSNWYTSLNWSELNKLMQETRTAFDQLRLINNGEEVWISEYLIFNARETPESVKDKFFADRELQDKSIKFYGKDGLLALVKQLNLSKDFYK